MCLCQQRHSSAHWAIRSIGAANVCVAPSCECYPTSHTDIPGKTYHIRVTNVEDLTPDPSLSLLVRIPNSVPPWIQIHSDQESGALTKELAMARWDCPDLDRLLYTTSYSKHFWRFHSKFSQVLWNFYKLKYVLLGGHTEWWYHRMKSQFFLCKKTEASYSISGSKGCLGPRKRMVSKPEGKLATGDRWPKKKTIVGLSLFNPCEDTRRRFQGFSVHLWWNFEQSMCDYGGPETKYDVGLGFSYRQSQSILWNRFLGFIEV